MSAPDQELLVAASAVLREHHGGAFTVAEGQLAEVLQRVTGKPWPDCLGEPQPWEITVPIEPNPNAILSRTVTVQTMPEATEAEYAQVTARAIRGLLLGLSDELQALILLHVLKRHQL